MKEIESVNPYDLHVMIDPVGRKVNSAAVSAELDLLLDHLFPIDLKLHFALRNVGGGILITLGFLFPWHGSHLFSWSHEDSGPFLALRSGSISILWEPSGNTRVTWAS